MIPWSEELGWVDVVVSWVGLKMGWEAYSGAFGIDIGI
jgi:hypothetical protein